MTQTTKQVLIVDDEPRLLQSLQAGLKSFQDSFQVLTAADGQEAVEILEREKIHLVITDLRMPNMDGFELLAYLSYNLPFVPCIVMTAFATPEIEERLNGTSSAKLLEKPIDFDRLTEVILDGLEQEGREGAVAGFSLANFLQLLSMEAKTCLLKIEEDGRETEGFIYLSGGEVFAALCGKLKGEEAFYRLLGLDNVRISFRKLPQAKVTRMIEKPLMALLVEGSRRMDEAEARAESPLVAGETAVAQVVAGDHGRGEMDAALSDGIGRQPHGDMQNHSEGDEIMGKMEECLEKLQDVEGFIAAGIFTPNGEMAGQVNRSTMKLAEVGSIANDVLLRAQKATDVMEVGRGNMVHVESPKAHIFARCLNENSDFSKTEAGKAHVHMVMLVEKDGNLAMSKLRMESVIGEVAALFR